MLQSQLSLLKSEKRMLEGGLKGVSRNNVKIISQDCDFEAQKVDVGTNTDDYNGHYSQVIGHFNRKTIPKISDFYFVRVNPIRPTRYNCNT